MPVIETTGTLNLEQILFATDFSEESQVAESYARALAQRFDSTLEIVHVFDSSRTTTYEEGVLAPTDEMRMKMRQGRLAGMQSRLERDGIKTRSMLRPGHPAAKELLRIMEEAGTDLLVVGTHSRAGLSRFIIGSTAELLIRQANRPVLTVGPHARPPQGHALVFNNIVYATDFSAQAAKAAVFALSFAEDSGAHLYFCHVVDKEEGSPAEQAAAERAFRGELKRMVPQDVYDWCSPECVVEHGSAAEGILELAKGVNADLIVLGARKSTFNLTHIERGVTLNVIAGAECPVLTIS